MRGIWGAGDARVPPVVDPLEIFITAAASIATSAFAVGVTYATMNGRIKTAETRASTAIEQLQTCLQRIAALDKWSATQDGELRLHLERIGTTRKDVDDLLATVFRSRFESTREMQAAKSSSRQDIPRQDSDPAPPLPPMRGRMGSRRE